MAAIVNSVRPTVCLNMIVKNEAHIITETLNSIKHYIDYWVVLDTGSDDNTQQLLQDYFAQENIPGVLIQDKWYDDFGKSRTMALEACRDNCKCDYVWIIDADDLVVGKFEFPADMTADAYKLRYYGDNTSGNNLEYYKTQLVKNNGQWRYRGYIHEFIVYIPNSKSKKTPVVESISNQNYYIKSRRLGSRSKVADKYLKDALLCRKGKIEDSPDLYAHYCYHAGQSFMDHKDFPNAIKEFQELIKFSEQKSGNVKPEFIYYAYYKIAKIYEATGSVLVKEAFLSAYKAFPIRAEPLHDLGNYFLRQGDYKNALIYMKIASTIPFPKENFSVFKEVYEWRIKYDLAFIYYRLELYKEAIDTLNSISTVNKSIKDLKTSLTFIYALACCKKSSVDVAPDVVLLISGVAARKTSHNLSAILTMNNLDNFKTMMASFINCCSDKFLIDVWILISNLSPPDTQEICKIYPFLIAETGEIGMRKLSGMALVLNDEYQFITQRNYIKPALEYINANSELKNCKIYTATPVNNNAPFVTNDFNNCMAANAVKVVLDLNTNKILQNDIINTIPKIPGFKFIGDEDCCSDFLYYFPEKNVAELAALTLQNENAVGFNTRGYIKAKENFLMQDFNVLNLPSQVYTRNGCYIKSDFVAVTGEKFNIGNRIIDCISNKITSNSHGFPKIIIQTYKERQVNDELAQKIARLKYINPEYNYLLFDDAECEKFLSTYFEARVAQAFKMLLPGAYRADLFRYCALYVYGGIYLDIKCDAEIPFDEMIASTESNSDLLLTDERAPWCLHNYCYNGFIIAKPRHPQLLMCVKICVDNILHQRYTNDALSITGPGIFRHLKGDLTLAKVFEYHLNGYEVFVKKTGKTVLYLSSPKYRSSLNTSNYYIYMWKNRQVFLEGHTNLS